MSIPRVSVVIPTRNRLPGLQRAVASVARQSYREIEVLVIDDGSTDGTRAWLESRAAAAGVRVVASADCDLAGGDHSPRGAAAARGDFAFGLRRLADAFATAPWAACDIATRRVLRQLRRLAATDRLEPWEPAVSVARGAEPAALP